MDYLFILGRILLGGYFIMNGWDHLKHLKGMSSYASSKGVPAPSFAVLVTGFMLLLGGLGVVLGVYMYVSLTLLAIFLLFVTFKMHAFWKAEESHKAGERINFYKNLALLGAVLMLFALPLPWALSLF